MALPRCFPFAIVVLGAVALPGLAAAPAPAAGAVTLPLADYRALVEKVERIDRERAGETAHREAPVAEVVAQRTVVTVGETAAQLVARYEALVQGHPEGPLRLPWNGVATRAEVHSLAGPGTGAALGAASRGERGLLLVTPVPGRYAVEIQGRTALADQGGVRRLTLAPVAAPVAEVEIDLPADLAWSAPGAVAVEERVLNGRRAVRLAVRRGEAPRLEIQRRFAGAESGKLLAQSVVLTLFQLRPDGLRRHDVVLYEVSRGSLASLAVDLPADLAVEQVATDEGDVVPVIEARHLTVHRKRQLQGVGYLVLTSTPRAGAALAVRAVVPGSNVEVRARYLAVASSVAADLSPQPAASWSRIDLADLPPALGEAFQSLDLSAAWRLTAPAGTAASAASAEPALAIALLPASPRLPTVVRRRDTTTLLTVDGTLVHRDRFTLDPAGTELDLTLPAGAVLWSTKVGDQAVRPVERQGTLAIPLGFLEGAPPEDRVVEVVAVLERRIPPGRSELAFDLPQVAAPVVEHQWRLLLPAGASYRFRSGDLQPAHPQLPPAIPPPKSPPKSPKPLPPPPPSPPLPASDEVITVITESPVLEMRAISTGATVTQEELDRIPTARDPYEVLKDLRQGLVGGVKPLPVTLPESGKALLLSGALPPAKVRVELDVKGKS
ncbi:MAG TPA: hypothetical protein VFE33_13080 [Thermoanaerobaculia bacterium]|nr:hypothetical protein [Thermoanaerobaculia bacterium]